MIEQVLEPEAVLFNLVIRTREGEGAGPGQSGQRFFLVRRSSNGANGNDDDDEGDNSSDGRVLLRVFSVALDMDVAYRTVPVIPTVRAAEVRRQPSDPPPPPGACGAAVWARGGQPVCVRQRGNAAEYHRLYSVTGWRCVLAASLWHKRSRVLAAWTTPRTTCWRWSRLRTRVRRRDVRSVSARPSSVCADDICRTRFPVRRSRLHRGPAPQGRRSAGGRSAAPGGKWRKRRHGEAVPAQARIGYGVHRHAAASVQPDAHVSHADAHLLRLFAQGRGGVQHRPCLGRQHRGVGAV